MDTAKSRAKFDLGTKTFYSPHETRRFVENSFEFWSRSNTFLQTMTVALSQIRGYLALIKIENVVLFSRTAAETIGHVTHGLTLLDGSGATWSRKYDFSYRSSSLHGSCSPPRRFEIASHSQHSIKEAQAPRHLTELESFLRLRNVYRMFVRNPTQIFLFVKQ